MTSTLDVTRGPRGVDPVYLDYNATTPIHPAVLEVMLPYLRTQFGNPSSGHDYGLIARDAVDAARTKVAGLLATSPESVVFTGSGTEADHLAIRGAALDRCPRGGHVITQVTEHPAVTAACRVLERDHDFAVTTLPVDSFGLVDPADLAAALRPSTTLVTIMHANNETGTIQRIAELADLTHAQGALFHTDAAQSAGKVPITVDELHADLVTIVGHKVYAPKGVAALYIGEQVPVRPIIDGGGQEHGLRAGTENVASIAGLGEACRLAARDLDDWSARITALRERLALRLEQLLPGRVVHNGHPTRRLPNTLNLSITGIDADRLLAESPGVAASTGSACHAGSTEPSPVLVAMGYPLARCLGALRLSLGRPTTADDVETAAVALAQAAARQLAVREMPRS